MTNSVKISDIQKLAIPALISGIAEPILSITDTIVVGNMDENATISLGAVGIVGSFISMLIWVFGQTRSVIASIIAQALGQKKLGEVKDLPAQGIMIIIFSCFLIILLTYFNSEGLFKFYNASGNLLKFCVEYFNIRVWGLPFTLLTIGIFGIFRGLQNTYYPMIIAIVGTILNIVLDIILVYGVEGFINPMFIQGAAYASLLAQICMAFLAVILLYKKTNIKLVVKFPFNPKIKSFMQMFGNLVIRTASLNVTLYFCNAFATKYGDEFIAAYTIAINLWFLVAFIIDGYSSAGTILSGKLYGEKSYGVLMKFGNDLTKIGVKIGIIMCIIGFIFYYPLGKIFNNDPVVLQEFYNIFWIVLAMLPLCSIAFIFDGLYKGLGWMKDLRNVLLFSTFIIFVPFVILFDHYDLGLHGIFYAFTLWILSRSIPLIIKFRKTFNKLS
ncbi:MAG: MATE family efflux transporter [Bacteroidota bacterium]|nr:MAG: MATE family efflux transporter [Bacteroidota bacterium]